MFVLVATALAGNLIGWPCQRLNWGWRNVWSSCSINSYAPHTANEPPAQVPTGFRQTNTLNVPSITLTAGGWFMPQTSGNAIPQLLCTSAAATGSGATANLRNRCRRSIDAYGALVKSCQLPPQTAGNRGPSSAWVSPDFAPATGHQPHVSNVAGLTVNAQLCTMPTGARLPADLATPSNTCPGLLGWFTVVFNACGFTNAPGLAPQGQSPNGQANAYTNAHFPLGSTAVAGTVLTPAVGPVNGAGYFCNGPAGPAQGPSGATGPTSWNAAGAAFRTSRCRKALDQFGRTAQRCHASTTTGTGPSQAGGYSDPLRFMAVGAAGQIPTGMNTWAPACN